MRRRALLRTSGVALALSSVPALGTATAQDGTESGYEPLGRVEVDGAAEAVVGDDGETAYVAATDGFASVDVTDPTEPTVLAEERNLEVDGDRVTEALDVDVDGDRLVLAGPANQSFQGVFEGFLCYDVSDPAEPELAGDPYETGFHIHNCYLDGDVLYVAANYQDENQLVVYDVADDEPTEIGRWSLLDREPEWSEVDWLVRYLHDVTVHDDVAYLAHWDPGTILLDVSDPTAPEYLSTVAETDLEEARSLPDQEAQLGLPGNDHYAAVDETGDLLAVGREAWATGGDGPDRPGGIDLYDVSDPSAPEHRATIEAPRAAVEAYGGGLWTTAHNFELRDGTLYSAWYQGGVAIHDVSDPSDPLERARWRDPNVAGFWTARVLEPGETFVASSTEFIPGAPTEGGLYTFPIEDGEQADPPSLTDPDDLEIPLEDTASEGSEADEEGGNETAADDEPAAADGGDTGGNETDSTSPDDSIPGFTATTTAGLAGGALALEWVRRRSRDGE
ncbi:LVIVD repeat-containing protein [Halopiger goleimassiliensis]|uniref:LVIVD repeat-containing protein n=1 Tax=Halopiger goleimassiliensis TaxID=1293048 RepID=UPI00067809E9|nr:hypothetical protein [Halopiger goleimassiliensis]